MKSVSRESQKDINAKERVRRLKGEHRYFPLAPSLANASLSSNAKIDVQHFLSRLKEIGKYSFFSVSMLDGEGGSFRVAYRAHAIGRADVLRSEMERTIAPLNSNDFRDLARIISLPDFQEALFSELRAKGVEIKKLREYHFAFIASSSLRDGSKVSVEIHERTPVSGRSPLTVHSFGAETAISILGGREALKAIKSPEEMVSEHMDEALGICLTISLHLRRLCRIRETGAA